MISVALPPITWREASVADSLAAAEVNVRSWQESFTDGGWHADPGDLSVERRSEMFRRRFGPSFYQMYVAEAEGQGVIGFVDVGLPREARWNCDAELYAIYVVQRYQRAGVGRRLFELACDAVLAAGRKSMYLIVLRDNPYRSFYERLGGRVLAQRPAGAVPGQAAHMIYAWSDLGHYCASWSPSTARDRERAPIAAHRGCVDAGPPVTALLGILGECETAPPSAAIDLDEAGWRALVGEAFRHGIAPLIWDRLRRDSRGRTAPSWALHDLERCYFRTRLDNLRLYGRVAEVLQRFAAQRIDVIVLKGAYLADAVYEDRALRGMSDVDLLVRREDLARVAGLLRDEGWEQPEGSAGGLVADGGHQLATFLRGGVQIEVHWNIEDDRSPFAIDIDALWQRSCSVEIAGAPARALKAEDLLLHVCLHASYNHGWLPFSQGLRPLLDIGACIARFGQALDWSVLARRALEWKADHCVWLALILGRDLASVRVPEHAIARLEPQAVDARIVRTARRLVLGDYYGGVLRSLPVVGRTWLTPQWRWLPRATRWSRHLLPTRKSLANAYPSLQASSKLLPLRYAAHLFDLGRDAASLACSRHARSILAHERDRVAFIEWLESPARAVEDAAISYIVSSRRDVGPKMSHPFAARGPRSDRPAEVP